MPYLNVNEVESALTVAAAPPNDGFTKLIKLPHKTWEKRECHAIKIASTEATGRCGVYLLGGIHAREWGSPDILINFVEKITKAYRTNAGLAFGTKTFTAQSIQDIVTTLDLIVFPQANPDGRNYSMTVDPLWRKNRRPAPASSPNAVGVDVNRNYDWLWNYPLHYSPQAAIASSTTPSSEVYIGPSPASEPETRNVVSIYEKYPSVAYFMDVHSFSEDILYPWGDDDDQVTDPNQGFLNAAYDGLRGVLDGSGNPQAGVYRAYVDPSDQATEVSIGNRMRNAIQAVRGRTYKVLQSASGLYVTSGTSDDYAYSRHIASPGTGKVLGYTLEWGPYNPADVAGSFHPPYTEMAQIINEVTAGLVEFCVAVVEQCRARPRIDWRKYASLVYILWGVIQDGGGVVITPGGTPVPVDPWGPMEPVLDSATRDAVIGAVVRELAELVGPQAARDELQRAADSVIRASRRGGRTGSG
jgi:carboxypeptidase T